MRIDNYANILASAKTNVGDLVSRLNPGDVIRAKVIEITSDEVLLKLFDGTVMRASMLEAMNAKAGDTVVLAVSSKHEGTLYLESVKNISQMNKSNPEALKQLLETLQIKPDVKNIGIAAELLAAGAPVTTENIEQAAALLSSKPALDSEKAVFLTLKGLNEGTADIELLSKLLDGDVKLGQQLKEVQVLLDQAKPTYTGKDQAADKKYANSARVIDSQVNTGGLAQTNASHIKATGTNQANAGNSEMNSAGLSTQIQSAEIRNDQPAIPAANHSAAAKTDLTRIPLSDPSVTTNNPPRGDSQPSANAIPTSGENSIPDMIAEYSENSASTVHAPQELSTHTQSNISGHMEKQTVQPEGAVAERFSKLIEAVRGIFVKTDSEKLSSELDVIKINNELNEKLELLKAVIKSSEDIGSVAREGLSQAAAQIEDTQRLFHQMNSSNIHYYQMPVNLAGHDTTAELYVMNRRQSKKKINTNDTVMFISLDTVNMGRVETLVDIKNRNITVNLRTESKQINEFIKTQIKDLYTGLAACGYKLAGVRYAIIDAATTPIQQERLLNGIAQEKYGKVDYRI